jgi:hypothetical protein
VHRKAAQPARVRAQARPLVGSALQAALRARDARSPSPAAPEPAVGSGWCGLSLAGRAARA